MELKSLNSIHEVSVLLMYVTAAALLGMMFDFQLWPDHSDTENVGGCIKCTWLCVQHVLGGKRCGLLQPGCTLLFKVVGISFCYNACDISNTQVGSSDFNQNIHCR